MNILKNRENQIRSAWKIIIVLITFTIIALIVSGIPMIIYFIKNTIRNLSMTNTSINIDFNFTEMNDTSTGVGFIITILSNMSLIFSVVIFWKVLEHRPISDIGLKNIRKSFKELSIGLIFGAISMTIVFLILIFTGNAEVTTTLNKPNFSFSLVMALIVFIFVGIGEEMFARGYCINVLKQTHNKWMPLIVSAAIFSALHALNPGITILSFINIFLMGILFGYMYIKSNNLWLPIGYHITWNYFQGNVFGFLVSGNKTRTLYTTKNIGDNILNGGTFGPEGGIIVTITILISIMLIYLLSKNNVIFKNNNSEI